MRLLHACFVSFVCVGCGSSDDALGPILIDGGTTDSSDAGSTACETGLVCGNACVNLQTSAQNCGACGLACAMSESCCKGACTSDPTCAFQINDVNPKQSWVSGNAWITVKGNGFGSGLHAWVGDGRTPTWVIDANTALILTPPAPVGAYDLHFKQGALTATLPRGVLVRTEGFSKQWVTVNMSAPRGGFPGITTLQDGRVLVAGGIPTSVAQPTNSAELYDPAKQAMVPAAGAMATQRDTVSAITLMDGRALVVGVCNDTSGSGCFMPGDRAIADLFDPKTNKFTTAKTPLVTTNRVYMRLVMLPNGKVLLTSIGSPTAEIFDPTTDSFSMAPFQSANSAFGWPVRLRDGRVLFASDQSEILDPDTMKLTPINAPLPHGAAAVFTLPDGRVMSPGGANVVAGIVTPTDEVTLVDANKPAVSVMSQKLTASRWKFGSALLGDGTLMVAAGVKGNYPITYGCQVDTFPTTNAVDVVDPALGTVSTFPAIKDNNMELVATTLLDGSIIIAGGAPCGGAGAYAYVYFLQSVPPPN